MSFFFFFLIKIIRKRSSAFLNMSEAGTRKHQSLKTPIICSLEGSSEKQWILKVRTPSPSAKTKNVPHRYDAVAQGFACETKLICKVKKNITCTMLLSGLWSKKRQAGRGILRISEDATVVWALKIDFQRFVELILAGWKEETRWL